MGVIMSNIYESIFKKTPFGYALYKIMLTEDGSPTSFEIIEMNEQFKPALNPSLS